ncbi:MAG: hypothetical protein WCF26_21405 [Candidatus Sulfotelmatobacter sp.]
MSRFLIAVFALAMTPVFAQVDVLTRRNDNFRSGVDARETILTQNNVRTRFGKLWTLYADAKIMAQPLYVSNLVVPSAGIVGSTAKAKCSTGCNAVLFATMKGTVYAYMADQKPATNNDTLLWATYLSDGNACKCSATGPQNGSGNFDMWAVDDPWWGVLSTPVIDRATNSLYAVTWTNDQQYRLYNLKLTTGEIQKGPVVIQGSIGNDTFFPGTSGFIQRRKQRAGLLLSNGLIYIAFGGDNPEGLAGWLFLYDAATLGMKTVWSPTPNGRNGGIWMAGDAPAADGSGNVYLQTGNGDLAPTNQRFGDSIVKLQFQNSALSVVGFFAPCNQMLLDQCDLDQGSSGAVLFDKFVIGGGKDGRLYLMNTANMPGYEPGPFPPTASTCLPAEPDCTDSPALIQKWQASSGHIHGAPIVWNGPNNHTWLYVMGEGDPLKAFPFEDGKFNVQRVKHGDWVQPKLSQVPVCQSQANHGVWMPGGLLSVSSNGSTPGTGIVWAIVPANGDANSCRGVKGMLMAFNAEDVTKELWRSQGKDATLPDTKDSFGLLARFNPPTIANGKVFVGTAGDTEPLQRYGGPRPAPGAANYHLAVYGLK